MISANTALFARLAEVAGEKLSSDLRLQARAIRTDAREKKWLKELTLRSPRHLVLSPMSKLALGDYEDATYLFAIGIEVDDPPAEFERVSLNAGMFTAIVAELAVPILRLSDVQERLCEYVFYPVDGRVELLDVNVVSPFFQGIQAFRIHSNTALTSDREVGLRAAIAAILGASAAKTLDWRVSTIDRLRYMIRDPNERAPFHLLLRAVSETRDDAAFLAVYRCLEQLFPIPAIGELSTELGIAHSALKVAETIERHLGWRRREEDAIAYLFGTLDGALLDRFVPVVSAVVRDGTPAKPVAKRLYELRNQCVHFRPIHSADGADHFANWLELVDLMLEAVQQLYARYARAFA